VLALIFAIGAAITGATRYAAAWQLFGRPDMTFSIHIGPNIRTSPYFEATVADGVRPSRSTTTWPSPAISAIPTANTTAC
jgi:hypothetical protein